MADAPIINSDLATSLEMTYVSDAFVRAGRNAGSPIKYFTDVSDEIGTKGKAVNVPIAPTLASALATEGATLTLDNTVATTATVTLNKLRQFAFSRGTVAGAIAGNVQLQMQLDSAVRGCLNDFEADCLSVITSGFTTNVSGSYNSDITQAIVLAATSALDEAKAPVMPRIGLVRHNAHAWNALVQLAGFSQYNTTGQVSPLVSENFGQGHDYAGCKWFKTQALPKSTNNIDNCILTPGSVAVAMRPLEMPVAGAMAQNVVDAESGIAFQIVAQHDIYTGTNVFVVKMLYGVSVVNEKFGALIKS